jgi:hypothetical protein
MVRTVMSAQELLTWFVIPALIALAIVVFALVGRLLINPAAFDAKQSAAVQFRFLGVAVAVVEVLVGLLFAVLVY